MYILIDKLFLLLLCTLLNLQNFPSISYAVIVILFAITISCFQIVNDNSYIRLFLILIYYLFIFSCKSATFLLPLVLYDIFYFKPIFISDDKYKADSKCPFFQNSFILALLLAGFSLIISENTYFISLLFCHILSFYFKNRTMKLEELHKNIIVLRDTSIENKILSEEKNAILLKNQAEKIYTTKLQERNRIAREIHDNVGHLLTRSILQLGALKTINRDENLSLHFETLSETLNNAMTSIRQSVHDLHDESIDLKAAITEITKDIKDFDVSIEYSVISQIPKNIKYELLAIIKEAVNNTEKYSNGDSIIIILREHPAFYQLLIEDNGTSGNIKTNDGIGLLSIKNRVEAMSGTLKISTDNNFRIFITVMKEA